MLLIYIGFNMFLNARVSMILGLFFFTPLKHDLNIYT